eukprot:6492543-Amphidinium_carterae.2
MEARHVAERLSVAEHDVSAATRAYDPLYSAGDEASPKRCRVPRSPKRCRVPRAPRGLFLRHRLGPLGVRPRKIPREKQTPIVFQTGPCNARKFWRTKLGVGLSSWGGGPERGRCYGPSVLQRHWSLSKQQQCGSHTEQNSLPFQNRTLSPKEIEPTNLCSVPNGVSLLAPVKQENVPNDVHRKVKVADRSVEDGSCELL